MRAVIQRVSRAFVTVSNIEVSRIGKGILALLGFGKDDSIKDLDFIADKCVNLRIFDDIDGKMNLSLFDISGEILAVSQFTLYGDANKGRRPSYFNAAPPNEAKKLYDDFIFILREKYPYVETGVFQANMEIELVSSGPVTILLDSKKNI